MSELSRIASALERIATVLEGNNEATAVTELTGAVASLTEALKDFDPNGQWADGSSAHPYHVTIE